MKYMGSKARIANEILPIILKNRKPNQYYVEPFCGGCNVIDKVDGNRIASDKNHYLVEMWKGLQRGEKHPLIIPKSLYSSARDAFNNRINKAFSDFEIGWIGWMGSYNGRFFDGGYSGHNVKINGGYRDYISESIRNIVSQVENISGIEFRSCNYDELQIPDNSIIYCDIPYKGTKQYGTSKDFDYSKFWQWCRYMSGKGHEVFVSEYNAPDDFECVWSKEVTNAMSTKKTYKPIEKLFKYNQI